MTKPRALEPQWTWRQAEPIKLTPCADWYHRWDIYGVCQRCGAKQPEATDAD